MRSVTPLYYDRSIQDAIAGAVRLKNMGGYNGCKITETTHSGIAHLGIDDLGRSREDAISNTNNLQYMLTESTETKTPPPPYQTADDLLQGDGKTQQLQCLTHQAACSTRILHLTWSQ